MEAFSELFYRDPYCREFHSVVRSCKRGKKHAEIVLEDTAFYPEGGGQPGDTGVLRTEDGREIRVLDTQRRGDEILHETDAEIPEGTAVYGELDWNRRFRLMQGHTGEHILSGLIHRQFGFDNVGFHLAEDGKIRIDFNGVLSWEQLAEMEQKANARIWADVPVREWYPLAEELKTISYRSKKELDGKVRLIDIPDADCCACCGTHVRRTGEVGVIKCLSLAHYKGGVRIEMLCGAPAFAWYQKILDVNRALAEEMSVKPEEIKAAADRTLAELAEEKNRAAQNLNRYFSLRMETLPSDQKVLVDFEEDLSPADARRFCDLLIKSGKADVAAVLVRKDTGTGFSYVIGRAEKADDSAVNLREKARKLNQALHGRGGGSPEMIQGNFEAGEEDIRKEIMNIF